MKKIPELDFVLRRYSDYLRKKGSPEIVVNDYFADILNIFSGCGKIENWRKITASQIEKFIRGQKWGNNTMAKRTYQMRSFFKFCRIKGYKTIENYKIFPVKRTKKEAKFLRDEEIKKILNYASADCFNFTVLKLFLTTGMRLAELCSLTPDKFEEAIPIGEMCQLNVIGKGSKLRSIFPPIETVELCKKLKNHGNIIHNFTRSKITYRIRQISKNTQIPFSAHTLRHTYLSHLARNGADLYKIQKIAGHTSIVTTSLYLHTCNKELAETASLINGLV